MSAKRQSVPGKAPVAVIQEGIFGIDKIEESTSHMAFAEGPGHNPFASAHGGQGMATAQKQEQSESEKQQQQKMQAACEQLVDVQSLTGSAFSHIGYCKICGWQSMGHDEQSCKDAVKTHAQIHWPEVQGTAQMSAAPPSGGERSEPAGGDKGGADSPHGSKGASKN